MPLESAGAGVLLGVPGAEVATAPSALVGAGVIAGASVEFVSLSYDPARTDCGGRGRGEMRKRGMVGAGGVNMHSQSFWARSG